MLAAAKRARSEAAAGNRTNKGKRKAKRATTKRPASRSNKRTRKNSAEYPVVTETSDWIPCAGVKFKKKANGEMEVLLRQD